MIKIEVANEKDVTHVALNLRAFDVSEIKLFRGEPASAVVVDSYRRAYQSWVVKSNDEPVAAIGIMPTSLVTGDAVPYFFATSEAERLPGRFARHSLKVVDLMSEWNLRNMTLSSNKVALRWLVWLGFQLHPEVFC